MKERSTKITALGVMLIISGLTFLIFGLSIDSEADNFRKTAVETTAVVTDIEVSTYKTKYGEKRTRRSVYVQYTADGQSYSERLDGYYDGMTEGQEITVFYNPQNPASVRADGYTLEKNSFAPFGAVAAVLGAAITAASVIASGRAKGKSGLVKTGVPAAAVVHSVSIDTSRKIKGRHPYVALCQADNPVTGETFFYNSEGVSENIRHLVGKQVIVYCDRENRNRYYVDLDSAYESPTGSAEQADGLR